MERGVLINIEGTDGSGKATQTKRLIERMNDCGEECVSVDFPAYNTPTGRIVGQCYLGMDVDFWKWKGEGCWLGDPDKVDSRIASALYAMDRRAARPFIVDSLRRGGSCYFRQIC